MEQNVMSRRAFTGAMGAMGAAAIAAAAAKKTGVALGDEAGEAEDPAMTWELDDPSEYWGEHVVTPRSTVESAYASVLPERANMAASDLLAMVKTEPEILEETTLPDGTVVPEVYVRLRNKIDRIGSGIGSIPGPTSYEMLMYLWSEEDAEHEVEMPILEYFSAYDYSISSGRSIEECQEILDDLAMRGMIMRCHRGGADVYHLLPYINGFWEFNELRAYFENGGDGAMEVLPAEALAAAGAFDAQGIGGASDNGGFNTEVPLFHTYPISADVVEDGYLGPYSDWKQIILNNTKITVSPCQCRLMWKAFDLPLCQGNHPNETCLSFGELAEYFDEVGIGRYISQDEAIAMVEECMDAGMVPESLSMQDVDIMCMCHGECCGNLSGYKARGGQGCSNVNMNGYLLKYDPETCISCGACIARCPMEAISFTDDKVCLHNNACVRCGQCVSVCPVGARILAWRGDYPKMGRDYVDAVESLAIDRMRRGYIVDFNGGAIEE
jgi:ferredoxin